MKKVALVIGHNERSKGAYSKILNQSEFDYYSDIATLISQANQTMDIYLRKPNKGYIQEMIPVVQSINLHGYDFVLELHFNSVSDPQVAGALCLAHQKSFKGQRIAKLFLNKLCKEYSLKNKGIINITQSNQRGGFGICKTNCPYILIEPFFAGNKEAEKFKDKERFASFIVSFIQEVQNEQ